MSAGELAPLRLERTFAATPQEVFEAWTNPAVLTRWWGPQRASVSPGCDVDLRVGGRYALRMQDPDSGVVNVVGGEYRELDPPRRLVYTWCWEDGDVPDPGHVSLVTVEFLAVEEGTTVVLEHSGLASESSRELHGAGWQGALENLERRIFTQGSTPTPG